MRSSPKFKELFKDPPQDLLLIALLVFAPLSYGMVHTWAKAVFSVTAAAIFILQYLNSPDRLKEICRQPIVKWGASFFFAAAVLQLTPMPQGVIKIISPAAAELYIRYSLNETSSAAWCTLSVYGWATIESLAWLFGLGMVFLAVMGRVIKRGEGVNELYARRRPYAVLGFLTGIFSILLHSLTDFNLHIGANSLYFTVILALAASMMRSKDDIDFDFVKRLSDAIILTAFLIAVFGIVQKFSFNGRIFWVGYAVKKLGASPFGPYINRNHYAGYMEICIPIALAAFAARLRTSTFFHIEGLRDKISWLSSPEAAKIIFSLFSAVVMTASLFLCASRSGITSFAIAAAVFLLTMMSKVSKKRRRFFGIMLAVVVVLMAAMILWMGTQVFIQRFAMLAKLTTNPEPRMYFWQGTIDIIRDFPLVGTGLGTFSSIFPKYSDPSFKFFEKYRVLYPENDYLQAVSEMGVFGLLIIVLFAAYFVRLYLKVAGELE